MGGKLTIGWILSFGMASAKNADPTARAILVAVLAMLAMGLVSLALGFLTGVMRHPARFPPFLLGLLNLLLPILAGAIWFRLKACRAMSPQERLLFAAGVSLANAVLALGILYAVTTSFGLGFGPSVVLDIMPVVLLEFVAAYGLGWLITFRRRPFGS